MTPPSTETAGDPALQAAVESLEAQLREFYEERERVGGRSATELAEMVDSLVEQLHALYGERDASAAA